MLNSPLKSPNHHQRRQFTIRGAVQGVGFRPFVYGLAIQHQLSGWVQNNASGVMLEVEGSRENIRQFESLLQQQKPALACIEQIESINVPLLKAPLLNVPLKRTVEFTIIASADISSVDSGVFTASVPADIAVCSDCLEEMRNPDNRRYGYAFINCSHCGPRYSIMTALPYDRSRTSMSDFTLCATCRAEYLNPLDRRFHAQPIACPDCGPQLSLLSLKDNNAAFIANGDEALAQAVSALQQGKIIAVKGLGGFHLMADAGNEAAVQLLRRRKHRKSKPFALMYPSLAQVNTDCQVSPAAQKLLCSAAAPIVILEHNNPVHIAPAVAPGNPCYGIMLPYTPLHHLLLQALNRPVIATSGNRIDEPICIDDDTAQVCLADIADSLLCHNRRIINRCDDSISAIRAGGEMVLRRARGYAPLPIRLKTATPQPLLAVGGQLKNTVALACGKRLLLSPHIGDLGSPEASAAHTNAIAMLTDFYRETPAVVAHDLHPDYRSTQMAQMAAPCFEHTLPVQHHYAHALSCMLDNALDEPCLAVVWDGGGYGDVSSDVNDGVNTDGSDGGSKGMIWGGEWLSITATGYNRLGHFLPFPLPGGESAIREPRRAALGLLYSMGENVDHYCQRQFGLAEQSLLLQAIDNNINTPLTTSTGRLFDVVAALIGLCQYNSFEGEAAMTLEYSARNIDDNGKYDFAIDDDVDSPCDLKKKRLEKNDFKKERLEKKPLIIDWRPMIRQILDEHQQKIAPGIISARFHNTLAALITVVAQQQQQRRVLLTGGCFQNKLLLEKTITTLRAAGYEPYWHHQIPPNDGGLAAGQIAALIRDSLREIN